MPRAYMKKHFFQKNSSRRGGTHGDIVEKARTMICQAMNE